MSILWKILRTLSHNQTVPKTLRNKSSNQKVTTMHLLEWTKHRILTPNADKDVKQHKLSFIIGANEK